MESFLEFCKNYIVDNIRNYGGVRRSDELGDLLTEGMNCDGSFTYSRYKAIEYLREWWDEAGEYFEYEKSNFGEVYHNPFENPEAFTVCMVIRGVEDVLYDCPFMDELEMVDLDDEETITRIIDEVNNVDEINL